MNVEIQNPFFIATTQRSGGFFLMSLLNSTGQVGYVHEYLYYLHEGWEGSPPQDEDILDAFEQFHRESCEMPNPMGHWGTKVDIRELWAALRWVELVEVDPQSIKWIWLRRRNKIRQAISYQKANKTEIWHLDKNDPKEKQNLARSEIEVDFQALCEDTVRFFVADCTWSNFFRLHDITPHTLYYEDFVDESTWELTVSGILDYLEVPYQLPLQVSTHRLKQGVGKTPASYMQMMKHIMDYGIPLEYTDLDVESCYELDLETF